MDQKYPMGQMTNKHIAALANYQLDLSDSEINRIERGIDWVRLIWDQGSVFVDNDMVVFTWRNEEELQQPVNASVHLLRLISSWGYDVLRDGTDEPANS